MGHRLRYWDCWPAWMGQVDYVVWFSLAQLLTIFTAINMALAFCMGTDLDAILNNPIGQPMATIFFNSFGQRGTLAIWAFVVIVQFFMGTS